MNLDFLITKREGLVTRAQALVTQAETDQRVLTAEELTSHADMLSQVQSIDATLQARDRQLAAEVAAAQPKAARAGQPVSGEGPPEARRREKPNGTDEYRQAFETFIRSGLVTPELRVHQIATDTAGGHLVPDEWEKTIIRKLRERVYIRQYATVIQTSMGDLNIPRETSIGTAAWTGENVGFNEAEDVFGNITLTPYKMSRLVRASEELLQDNMFDLGAWLAQTFAESFADLEEAAFMVGDASSKPTGVIPSATVGKTASATNAITFDEIQDLYFSVKPAYRDRGVWIMNDAVRSYLGKIKTGVASDIRYAWQQSLSSPVEPTLFGRPIISSTNAPSSFTTNNRLVTFGDLSYYWIADKPGIPLQRLNELYAASGNIGFRAFRRTDGELTQAEAVKVLRTA
jgi:HK97 family phage major capsid protein